MIPDPGDALGAAVAALLCALAVYVGAACMMILPPWRKWIFLSAVVLFPVLCFGVVYVLARLWS